MSPLLATFVISFPSSSSKRTTHSILFVVSARANRAQVSDVATTHSATSSETILFTCFIVFSPLIFRANEHSYPFVHIDYIGNLEICQPFFADKIYNNYQKNYFNCTGKCSHSLIFNNITVEYYLSYPNACISKPLSIIFRFYLEICLRL